jgi:hypothetical protein
MTEEFSITEECRAILFPIADWELDRIRNLLNCVEEFTDLFESLIKLHNQEITVEQFEAVPYGKEYWAIYTLYRCILTALQVSPDPTETNVGDIIEELLLPRLKNRDYEFKNL